MTSTPTLLPVRMLNEMAYCPRLFHLEWVQQEWADNAYTLDGQRIHKRVDRPVQRPSRPPDEPPRANRSLDLADEELGLVAKIDIVEWEGDVATPVDYKRGRLPKNDEGAWEPERVQIAAQALLLRAHGFSVDRGFLYFAGSGTRVEVPITDALVERTLELRDQARAVAERDEAPPPLDDDRRCAGCSLSSICLPDEHALLLRGARQDRLRLVRAQAVEAYPLHVTEPGSVVRKVGDELVIEPREGPPVRARLVDVSSLQLHGSSKVTTPALHALMSTGAAISYLSRGGWLYGRTRGPAHKNVLLRLAQYRAATSVDASLQLSRRFVRAKLRNGRTFIRRHAASGEMALEGMETTLAAVDRADSLAELLGLEGHGAGLYFRAFARVLGDKTDGVFHFERRNRRPAQDPTNALLSFAYALLTTSWTETVDRVGFDAYLGFYHQPKYGKPALALDMMEEFRPLVADSIVLKVLSRRMLDRNDFIRTKTSCTLSKSGRRRFIAAYEARLSEKVTHPVFGYRVSYRQVFEIQARLLGRFLTGEIDDYPEFVTR